MALNSSVKNAYRIPWTPTYGDGETPPTTPKTSDAYYRELFNQHSIHIVNPGAQTVVIQVSNVPSPVEGTDADWVNVDSSASTAKILTPAVPIFRWARFKVSGGTGVAASVHMLSANRVNS